MIWVQLPAIEFELTGKAVCSTTDTPVVSSVILAGTLDESNNGFRRRAVSTSRPVRKEEIEQ